MGVGTRIGRAWAVLLVALLLTACGGDGQPQAVNPGEGDNGSATPDNVTSFELHESISNLPLPSGYEIPFPADAYSAAQDQRETVVQVVTLSQSSDEVAAFLLVELPAAGFTILDQGSGFLLDESDIVPGVGAMIAFQTPDGIPGQITVNPVPGPPGGTNLNINLYRAG